MGGWVQELQGTALEAQLEEGFPLHTGTQQYLSRGHQKKRNLSKIAGEEEGVERKVLVCSRKGHSSSSSFPLQGYAGRGVLKRGEPQKNKALYTPSPPPVQDALVDFLHVAVGWSGVFCHPLGCQQGTNFRGQAGSKGWRANSLQTEQSIRQ